MGSTPSAPKVVQAPPPDPFELNHTHSHGFTRGDELPDLWAEAEAAKEALNYRNRFGDYLMASVCYFNTATLHALGQSSLMTFGTLWVAGSYYVLTSEMRRHRAAQPPGDRKTETELSQQEAVAAWLWFLASVNQYRATPRFVYSGISCFTGLTAAAIYSARFGAQYNNRS
jgi:hypothetical protein